MFFIIPISLQQANEFIMRHHRHHKKVQGHRFSIGCVKQYKAGLVGIATIGRPVARNTNQQFVAEVTRLATDGTYNACSTLYAAAARICQQMGFISIQTFILENELGTSLKAANWEFAGVSRGGTWVRKKRPRRIDQPLCPKQKWVKYLNRPLWEVDSVA